MRGDVYTFTERSIWDHLLALYGISTRAGGLDAGVRLNQAGRLVADYLLKHLRRAGLEDVREQPVVLDRWWPERWSLAAMEGGDEKPLEAFPLWYCSPTEPVTLDVVDVGYGTAGELRGKDVRGRAALLRMKRIFHFQPTHERTGALRRLAERRAAGVIVVNVLHDAPAGMLAVSPKTVMECSGIGVPLYPLPAFSIGMSDGLRLADAAARGRACVKARLAVSVTRTLASNVLGELPGGGECDETVLVGGHYDTWFGGALDNLASQAGMIELARHFASLPGRQRKRNMLFAGIFGHEIGNQGHGALAAALAPIKDRITCFYDLDGSGSTGWEVDHRGRIVETGRNDVCGIVSSSNALSLLAHEALYDQDIFSIQFYDNARVADLAGALSELGIPTLLIISKHLFYHTPLDTPDRIPPRLLLRRMEVNRQVIGRLLASEPGYYIATNTNPSRKQDAGPPRLPDIGIDVFPPNPRPWVDGPPEDLLFEVVPERARVLSPVLVWRSHFVSRDIARPEEITWSFGNLIEKLRPSTRIGPASGTIYLAPGTKTIRMTVTDRQGRRSSVERSIEVTW